MTCKLCNDTGEQRYWEGRWRDEKAENERLRAILRHADDVVIWEHTSARPGFQEEIEGALGIGADQQSKQIKEVGHADL